MTFAPPSITEAMAVMTGQGFANAGIVGDAAHVATGGYHEGKDDLTRAGLVTTDYSVRLARDKAGLSNAASAMDISRGARAATTLQSWSRWLVDQCKAKAPGSEDIREVIYSPDGKVVRRWDNYARVLYNGGDGTGQGDNSHLWHTHISFFRDSEFRSKAPLFKTAIAPPTPAPEADMILSKYLPGYLATVKVTANVRSAPALVGTLVRSVTTVETWTVVGLVAGDKDPDNADPATQNQWYARWTGTAWEYTAYSNVTKIAAPVSDTTALTQQVTSLTQQVTSLNSQLGAAAAAAAAAQNAATAAEAALADWKAYKAAEDAARVAAEKVGL